MDNFDTKKILLKSNRTGKEYEATLFIKGDNLIVTHRSLDAIYYGMSDDERPSFKTEVLDTSKWPGTAPQYALKGIMEKDGILFERIGSYLDEMRLRNPNGSADYIYPIEKCERIAFDRVFIRYMQFDINTFAVSALYSTEEIAVDADTIRLDGKSVTTVSPKANNSVPVPQQPQIQPQTAPPAPMPQTPPVSTVPEATAPPVIQDSRIPAPPAVSGRKNKAKSEKKAVAEPQAPAPTTASAPGLPEQLPFDISEFVPDFNSGEMPGIPDADGGFPGLNIPDGDSPLLPPDFDANGVNPPMPSMPPVGDIPSAPAVENPTDKQMEVYGVSFDISTGKSMIKTSFGEILYDPMTNRFISDTVDLSSVDLAKLYNDASQSIGGNLQDFTGMMMP